MSEKFKKLKERLLSGPRNGYDRMVTEQLKAMDAYCKGYMAFLNASKTERLCAAESIRLAVQRGYRPHEAGEKLRSGDKVFVSNRGKSVMLAHIGRCAPSEGVQIAAAHIDSPRLDIKPNPLYEENELAFLKTHYYGGIRKYQWVAIPLELRGVIAKKDGSVIPVNIGAEPGDTKLVITDLLPHLGQEQAKKPLATAIPGESLNLLVGSRPLGEEDDTERVKVAVMNRLHDKYGIAEDDFASAELEAVPAFRATEVGMDRSMIGAYGHDDRVCAYAALKGLLDLDETPEKTAVCVLTDKEEIGSEGTTGMKSAAFDGFLEELCENGEERGPLRACLERSFCLSADVTAAYDPNFADVYDKRNAAYLNHGIGIAKYTGSRGKSGASDADAETVAYIRHIFDAEGIVWQMDDMGKVDAGGGGTVAKFMAERNITTLDAGVPVLSMHAPFEIVAKLDCYETYRGMMAVYQTAFA